MDGLSIVLLVLTLIVVVTLLLRSRQRAKLLARLTPQELETHQQCMAGDKAIAAAQAEYDKARKIAEKALKKTQTPAKLAAAGGGNFVTPISLRLNGNDHPLTQDVVAVLDTTGTVRDQTIQRTSLTRIAVGGIVAGPIGAVVGAAAQKTEQHKIDTREHYVMVTGSDWQEVVKLGPEPGEQARSLTQAINVAAKNVIPARITHEEAIREAETELARATADTASLDGAKALREALGEDPLARLKRLRKNKAGELGATTEPAPPPRPSPRSRVESRVSTTLTATARKTRCDEPAASRVHSPSEIRVRATRASCPLTSLAVQMHGCGTDAWVRTCAPLPGACTCTGGEHLYRLRAPVRQARSVSLALPAWRIRVFSSVGVSQGRRWWIMR